MTTYFKVKVFNAPCSSTASSFAASCYQKHKMEKKRKYEKRDVEYSTFSPSVMSTSGGMGPSAAVVVKRFTELLTEKIYPLYSRL